MDKLSRCSFRHYLEFLKLEKAEKNIRCVLENQVLIVSVIFVLKFPREELVALNIRKFAAEKRKTP